MAACSEYKRCIVTAFSLLALRAKECLSCWSLLHEYSFQDCLVADGLIAVAEPVRAYCITWPIWNTKSLPAVPAR